LAIISRDEALNLALLKYKEALPPNTPGSLTHIEWAWLNALATRAAVAAQSIEEYTYSWTMAHLFKEGIGWQIRMEIPSIRKAGLRINASKGYVIPTTIEVKEALDNANSWGEFWETFASDIVMASFKGDPEFNEVNKMLWPPKFVRLPSGWRDITQLWIEMVETRTAPGPKPRWLIGLCKEIVRAFPLPVKYPQGEIDLLSTAVGIIVKRLNK